MKQIHLFSNEPSGRYRFKHGEVSPESFEGKEKKNKPSEKFRGSVDAVKEIHEKEAQAPNDELNLSEALNKAQEKKAPSMDELLRSDIQQFGVELQRLYQKGIQLSDLTHLRAQCTALYSPDRTVQDIFPTGSGITLAVEIFPGEPEYGVLVDFSGNVKRFEVTDGVANPLYDYADGGFESTLGEDYDSFLV